MTDVYCPNCEEFHRHEHMAQDCIKRLKQKAAEYKSAWSNECDERIRLAKEIDEMHKRSLGQFLTLEWNEFAKSNPDTMDPGTLGATPKMGVYLENRLRKAFGAGTKAQQKYEEENKG